MYEVINHMGYNDDLRINRTLQKIMIDRHVKNNDLAAQISKSKQVVSNQLNRQVNLTIDTIDTIADALGYDVKLIFVDRKTGKEIDCDG